MPSPTHPPMVGKKLSLSIQNHHSTRQSHLQRTKTKLLPYRLHENIEHHRTPRQTKETMRLSFHAGGAIGRPTIGKCYCCTSVVVLARLKRNSHVVQTSPRSCWLLFPDSTHKTENTQHTRTRNTHACSPTSMYAQNCWRPMRSCPTISTPGSCGLES